jgi:hypothetical protein
MTRGLGSEETPLDNTAHNVAAAKSFSKRKVGGQQMLA